MNKVVCVDNTDIYGVVLEELKINEVYEVNSAFAIRGMILIGKTRKFSYARSIKPEAYMKEWKYTTDAENYYWINSLNFNYDKKFFITLAEWRDKQINSILED